MSLSNKKISRGGPERSPLHVPSNQQGFALLEVLGAMFVLSVCCGAILYGVTTYSQNLDTSWQRLQALELAQGRLETSTALEYNAISSIAKTDLTTEGDFKYSVTVHNDAALKGLLKNIEVTVYYTDLASGLEKSVSVSGAKAKR